MKQIPKGVYPVMITPFTKDNKIDYAAVKRIVEFYVEKGCQGVFAVCQSSEMFYLSEDERVELAKAVVNAAAGRLCVVASGHISDSIDDQIRELMRIAAAGVDAVVMVSNRLAAQDEDDSVLISNMERILKALPGVTFGMYECPYPYKRLLSDRVLSYMAESERFSFIKDTCCDAELIARRVKLLNGRVQLFNANAATVLETVRAGADGFSGIMANYHPELYNRMIEIDAADPEKADKLSALLALMSSAEMRTHPVCCKYHMNLIGIPMEIDARCVSKDRFGLIEQHAIDDLLKVEELTRLLFM